MGQIKFLGAVFLMAVFVVAIITFATQFGNENNTAFTVDGELIDTKNAITGNLSTWIDDVNSSSKSLSTVEITSGETFQRGGQLKMGQDSAIDIVYSSISLGFNKIFGSDDSFDIILTSLLAFIVIVGTLYWYKAWIGRNPD